MSAQAETRIFGLKLNVNPKILVAALIALTLLFVWYNFRSDNDHETPSAVHPAIAGTVQPIPTDRSLNFRRPQKTSNERGTLKLRPVNPGRGDIDPTLRLSLLERLQAVKPEQGSRNLFETGAAVAANLPGIPKVARMMPKPLGPPGSAEQQSVAPAVPVVNIPLKYYGYVKPSAKSDGNRGFFMDGDNILIATEGDVLEQRFLVVALTPNQARLEDIQIKQGQDLPFTPEAAAQ